MEIELFTGDVEEMQALGQRLMDQYDLTPEEETKLSKGLKLLGKIKS